MEAAPTEMCSVELNLKWDDIPSCQLTESVVEGAKRASFSTN